MYEDGARLTQAEFAALAVLWDEYKRLYDDSMGYDEGAREAKANLAVGIAIARGEYVGKAEPQAKRV